jgi:hypothetical protein
MKKLNVVSGKAHIAWKFSTIVSLLYDLISDYALVSKEEEVKEGLEKIFKMPIERVVKVWKEVEDEYGRKHPMMRNKAFVKRFRKEGVVINSKYEDLIDRLTYG